MTIQFRGGAKLDRALADIANLERSKATTMIYSSLSTGATQVKKAIKKFVPEMKGGRTETLAKSSSPKASSALKKGIKITKGQLKRSLQAGQRRQVKGDRKTFMAAVWFKGGKGSGVKAGATDDGFFSHWLMHGTRNGISANNFVKKGVKAGEPMFKNKVGGNLARKIAAFSQAKIDRL